MDQTQDQHPAMSGDDELAKALQGGLQFEETPVPGGDDNKQAQGSNPADAAAPTLTNAPDPLDPKPTKVDDIDPAIILPTPPADDAKPPVPPAPAPDELPEIHRSHDSSSLDGAGKLPSTGNSDLDKIKTSALEELRPLVGKLNLPADEKFDTLLLIIRSTDDQSLLDEAHDAAKEITDETKRAQALLDIIKEIDYFSTKH
ncbi:MAG TPA: hypothetical protein VLA88_04890 [Candidatus Saccharimonadales bacterium]|nr:hypothetical protein [Candidatus Saccharimonadales bacterium]